MNTQYAYEIEFDVMGSCREQYDRWLSEHSLEWVSHPAVTTFDVQYNTNGLSPEVKFAFGFSSLDQWATFVDSEIHKTAKATLRSVATGLDGTLWKQGGIKLDPTDSADNETSLPSTASVSEKPQ